MGESSGKAGPPRWAIRASAPLALALSGRRWFPLWAVMHHRGRKSGTEYAIPVAVIPTVTEDVFLIGLPWGAKTEWARNVLAAGGAILTWQGRIHAATEPRIVGGAEAAALARPAFRGVVRRFPVAIALRRR